MLGRKTIKLHYRRKSYIVSNLLIISTGYISKTEQLKKK